MKKFIYTFILFAGFQFAQGQQITNLLVLIGETSVYKLDSMSLSYTSGAQTVTLPVSFICKNTGSALNAGDSIAFQLVFNETTQYLPITFPVSATIGTDSLISTPFVNVPLAVTSIKTGNYANKLCGSVPYVVYGGAGNPQTPVTEAAFCAVFTITATTGIADVDILNEAKIYPNPVRDNLKIENLNDATDISIYTITGQLVRTVPSVMGSVDIDMGNLSNGLYIVKMQSGKNIRTEKIQVIR